MAAPAWVQNNPVGGSFTATTSVGLLHAASGVEADHIALWQISVSTVASGMTVTWPAGWNQITSLEQTTDFHVFIAWKRCSGSEDNTTDTATLSTNGDGTSRGAYYSGCVTSGDPYEGYDPNQGTSNTQAHDAIVTAGADRMGIHMGGGRRTTGITPPATWTERIDVGANTTKIHVAEKSLPTAGTESATTQSLGTSVDWISASFALKPAALTLTPTPAVATTVAAAPVLAVTVTPGVANTRTDAPAPVLAVTVLPSAAAATLVAPSVTVDAATPPTLITPTPATVPLVAASPTLLDTLLPAAVASQLVAAAATVSITLLPAAVAVVLAAPAPAVSVTLLPAAASAPVLAPASVLAVVVLPQPAAAATSAPAPAVAASLLPSAAAAILVAPAPTLAIVVLPSSVAAPTVAPSVTVSVLTGGTIGPDAAVITLVVPDPLVEVGVLIDAYGAGNSDWQDILGDTAAINNRMDAWGLGNSETDLAGVAWVPYIFAHATADSELLATAIAVGDGTMSVHAAGSAELTAAGQAVWRGRVRARMVGLMQADALRVLQRGGFLRGPVTSAPPRAPVAGGRVFGDRGDTTQRGS